MQRLAGLSIVLGALAAGAWAHEPVRLPIDRLPPTLSLTEIPLGLDPERPVPAENPLTQAKVQLGRRLFFDSLLSADHTVSCASCHDPAHGFASTTATAVGIRGQQTLRNAPSILNRAYGKFFFWDGRQSTLENQALEPIENSQEMGNQLGTVVDRLQADSSYRTQFQAAFPDGVTATNLGRALASFERVLLTGGSRVDRFRTGEVQALNESELHGLWLFESRARCWRCHSGRNFTDEQFHNTGIGWGKADLGRFAHTRRDEDRGRFKTPTLRGLTATAPYMHDGSLATLQDVVDYYNRGGNRNPNLDPIMAALDLSDRDRQDLVAFLKALSDTGSEAKRKP